MKMNCACISFAVVLLFQYVFTSIGAEFSPLEWSEPSSPECGRYSNPDFTGVLTKVEQMLLDSTVSAPLPKSCMEIKEISPDSPSGYYTISSGTTGSAAVVYCNMNGLYSCQALEQVPSGIREDVDSLCTCPLLRSCSEVKEKCPQCTEGIYKLSADPNNVNFCRCVFANSTYCNIIKAHGLL